MTVSNPASPASPTLVASGTTLVSGVFTPTAGQSLIAIVAETASNSFTLSISDPWGLTWTQVASTPGKGGTAVFNGCAIFVSSILNGTPAAGQLTITSSQAITAAAAEWYAVTGSAGGIGTSGIDSSGSANQTSPVSVVLGASPAATSLLIGLIADRTGVTPTLGVPSGWTAQTQQNAAATHELFGFLNGSGAQSNAFTFSNTPGTVAAVVVEIQVAPAPPPTTPPATSTPGGGGEGDGQKDDWRGWWDSPEEWDLDALIGLGVL